MEKTETKNLKDKIVDFFTKSELKTERVILSPEEGEHTVCGYCRTYVDTIYDKCPNCGAEFTMTRLWDSDPL